ncbi:hypothetical protein B9Z55_023232 [Caenorhabditis nigoni]|uniref:CUB-like domain-containing protein n=1 Tax=Caenorhabditis nigoni TaxID=1611254 RepID=A0A2G5SP88_9PELO|nr:hypothetical protein B9Z55_023232 [Caenorhabditis nigoni]
MKKHVWIVPILLFLFPVPTVSVCSKVHSKNESTGSGNFECVNGGCWIQIDPSPTKGIELTLQGKGNKLLIYMITSGKQKQEFLQRESEKTDERYYLADVGQGFSIKWNESCNSDTGAPHYTFDRAILDPYYCGPYLRYIGNEVVTIQKERRAKSQFYCRYHMVPLNSNISSETIYVISGAFDTFEVLDGNNEPYTITLGIYIYAITTNRSCVCQDEPVEVSNGQVIHIQSPGFPDFMCPSSKCEKLITFSKFNGSDEYIQRALVTLEARTKAGTDFSIVSKKIDIRFNADMYSEVTTNFLLEPVDMKVTHNTQLIPWARSLYHGPEGHFNLSIQSIKIRRDCDCSFFKQKKYDKQEHKIEIKIPAHCELIFCDWIIASGGNKEMTIPNVANSQMFRELHHSRSSLLTTHYHTTSSVLAKHYLWLLTTIISKCTLAILKWKIYTII